MLQPARLALDETVDALKAAGEPTRLRLLVLLSHGDLTVTEMTDVLGQSQPRISRHLKLLVEAGLIERYQEGAWAYFRLVTDGTRGEIAAVALASVQPADSLIVRDGERLKNVKQARADRAQAYFAANAASWGDLRRLHVPDEKVEAEILRLIGRTPFDSLLDLGTGTGRLLELLSSRYRRALGIDANRDMLAIARTQLDEADITHASVRQADIFNLPLERESFDVVTIHQVLHFLHDPEPAIAEAARVLRPGGRIIIVDFAPHAREELRTDHAHARLGFPAEQVNGWLRAAGLDVEQVVDLPGDGPGSGQLTVTLWLARDPRLLIASSQPTGTA